MPDTAYDGQPYVFISYASADRERVLRVVDALTQAGISVWRDQDDITGGTAYGPAIASAIRGSGAVLVLCSDASLASRNVRQEVAIAWKHERPCLPLLLDPMTVLPEEVEYWLEGAQWIEVLDHPVETWLPKVTHALPRLMHDEVVIPTTPAAAATSSSPPPRTSLPSPPSSFVGREGEVAKISALLSTARLVTLTGTGGVGKTRLALAVAERVQARFADGVVFVSLAPVRDADLVVSTIAQSLGVRESGERTLLEAIGAHLRSHQVLLVIDNFEQVLEAAPVITELLGTCPELTVLVTSRAVLNLSGEHAFPIPPLDLPDLDRLPSLDQVAEIEAIQLFVARAQAAIGSFTLTAENAPAVAAICTRLDGLPLAIELAAARSRLLTPQAMRARLEHRLPLLTSGMRDAPARQQTMRDTIAWSYELLTPEQQFLLRQLSVFSGGWTLDAAEVICDADLDVFEGLTALAEHSLVRQIEPTDGETRFGMLETIREFALDELARSGEGDAVRRAHAAYFRDVAERAEPELRGSRQTAWIARLEADLPNLRAVLDWSLAGNDKETALRLSGALYWFWFMRGRVSEGRDWFERARAAGRTPPDAAGKLAIGSALLAWRAGDHANSKARSEEALTLFRECDDRWGTAFVIHHLGHLAEDEEHDLERAIALLTDSAAQFQAIGDPWGVAFSERCLALTWLAANDYDRATSLLQSASATFREVGDEWNLGGALSGLGDAARAQERFGPALLYFQESLLIHHWSQRNVISVTEVLRRLAQVLVALGDMQQAVRFFGYAEARREHMGVMLFARHRLAYEQTIAEARAALGEEQFQASWEEGRSLSLAEAVEAAANIRIDPKPGPD